MKIVGYDDFDVAVNLFAEYDPYLIDATRIKVIGERGIIFFLFATRKQIIRFYLHP